MKEEILKNILKIEKLLKSKRTIITLEEIKENINNLEEEKASQLREAIAQVEVYPMFLRTLYKFVFVDEKTLVKYLDGEKRLKGIKSPEKKVIAFFESIKIITDRLDYHIRRWRKMDTTEILVDEVLWGIVKVSLEDQIFLEASRINEVKIYLN